MEYTDIQILECNKKQSINAGDLDSDNALFTNKLGKNIQLKQGDTVNIEYSFINEKGCGANTIEIEGKDLGVTKDFIHTDITDYEILPYQYTNTDESDNEHYGDVEKINVNNFDRQQQRNTANHIKTIMLRDDEVNIQQHYYKTANGEGYWFLPRAWATATANLTAYNNNLWTKGHYRGGDASGNGNIINNVLVDNQVISHGAYSLCLADYLQMSGDPTGQASFKTLLFPKTDNSRYTIFMRDASFYNMGLDPSNPTRNQEYFRGIGRQSPGLRKFWKYTEINTIKIDKGYNSPSNIAKQFTEQLQQQKETVDLLRWDDGKAYKTLRKVSDFTETTTYKVFNTNTMDLCKKENHDCWLANTTTPADIVKACLYDQGYETVGFKRPDLRELGQIVTEGIYGLNDDTYGNNKLEDTTANGDFIYGNRASYLRNTITTGTEDDATSFYNQPIVTSWEWTDKNRKDLSNLFKAQGKYPELFDAIDRQKFNLRGLPDNEDPPIDPKQRIFDYVGNTNIRNINNCRFLHGATSFIAKPGGDDQDGTQSPYLGSDRYENTGSIVGRTSVPVFFSYDPTREDMDGDGEQFLSSHIAYGCMTKTTVDGVDWITLHPEVFPDGVANWFVGMYTPLSFNDPPGSDPEVVFTEKNVLIGWDNHFTSYGQVAMNIFSGYTPYRYDTTDLKILQAGSWGLATQVTQDAIETTLRNDMWFTMNKCFLGGSNSALTFGANGHFYFEYLHEPERHGQPYNAGENPHPTQFNPTTGAPTTLSNPLLTEAPNEVYKINKLLGYWSWSPDYATYVNEPSNQSIGAPNPHSPPTTTVSVQRTNPRIQELSVMDSVCGLYMDLGKSFTKETWNDGLLGILGFTYEQYNPDKISTDNNLQARINFNNNFDLEMLTTNSDFLATEQINYNMNVWGGIQYTNQLSMPTFFQVWASLGNPPTSGNEGAITQLQNIVENTQSFQAGAEGLPRKMLRPYFTIRSDIVSENKYIGGNTIIPGDRARGGGISLGICGIVNKENGDGDYYFSTESPMIFTITKDTNISSITTSIHDPDGKLVTVGDECCVMYKVTRARKQDPSIAQEIMESFNTKKK